MNQKQQDAEGVGGVTAVVADLAVTLASGSVPVSCSRKNRTERPWASQQPYPSGCSLVVVFQKKSAQRFSGHHMVSPPAPSGPSELNAADIDIAASRRRPWWTPCSPSCERMCVLECGEHGVANVGKLGQLALLRRRVTGSGRLCRCVVARVQYVRLGRHSLGSGSAGCDASDLCQDRFERFLLSCEPVWRVHALATMFELIAAVRTR